MKKLSPKQNPTLLDVPSLWQEEWQDMPEFVMEDLRPYRVINVRFRNDEDVKAFAKLLGQHISPKQRALWFPAMEHRRASHLRYTQDTPEPVA
jgi:hypothetical protein